jgi:hypothetical protein
MHIWFPPIISFSPMEFYLGLNWLFHSIWLSYTTINYRGYLNVKRYKFNARIFLRFIHNSFNFFGMFGCMYIIFNFFIFIFIFKIGSSSHAIFYFYYYSCNALCSLYMTFKYFKSFFIIEVMKCKNWESLLSNISKCDAHFETNSIIYLN